MRNSNLLSMPKTTFPCRFILDVSWWWWWSWRKFALKTTINTLASVYTYTPVDTVYILPYIATTTYIFILSDMCSSRGKLVSALSVRNTILLERPTVSNETKDVMRLLTNR